MGLLATKSPGDFGIREHGFDAPSVRLPVARSRVIVECLSVLAVAAVTLWIALRQEDAGAVVLVVPGIAALILLVQLSSLTGAPAVVLTRTGFEARRLWGSIAADWRDCGPFEVRNVYKQGRMVTFHPAGRSGAFGGRRGIPNRSELNVHDLCRVMNLYREHALATVG